MIFRRLTLLLIALCVTAGFASQTGFPVMQSVCRMTGLPMAPDGIVSTSHLPIRACCGKVLPLRGTAAAHAALRRSSCCVLRAATAPLFVARAAGEQASFTDIAFLTRGLDAVVFAETAPSIRFTVSEPFAPRGPPRRSSSPRAPPLFS